MSRKIIIDLGPDKDEIISRLKKQKINIIREYPRFALIDALPQQLQYLRDRKVEMVPLGERSITVNGIRITKRSLARLPKSLQGKPKSEDELGYYLVALIGPITADWKEELTSIGAEIVESLPSYGFVIKGIPPVIESINKLDFVDWTSLYPPGLKLGANLFRTPARHLKPSDLRPESIKEAALRHGQVELTFFKGEDPTNAVADIEALGGVVTLKSRNQLRVRILPEDVSGLTSIEGVKRIDSYFPIEKDNDVSAVILHVPDVRASHELDGEEQIIAVMDTGLDTGVDDATMHQDFQGRIKALVPISGRVDAIDTDGHGTHVSGTLLGDGSKSGGQYAGMAPGAKLIMLAWDYWGAAGDIAGWFDEARNRNARIQNNSWGSGYDSSYNEWPEAIDEYVWEHRDFLPVFSAGNKGRDNDPPGPTGPDGVADLDSLGRPAVAKNCLTVGGCENNRPTGSIPTPGRDLTYGDAYTGENLVAPIDSDHFSDNPDGMFYHSSRGPTDDGRIKPDVVAAATNVLSTRSSQGPDPIPLNVTGEEPELPSTDPLNPFYFWDTGTSMAAPAVAGCAALVRQYLIQQRGHERGGDHPRPSAALLKAILINGSIDMQGQYTPDETGSIPNPNEGWGRVNINNALFPETTRRIQFSDSPEYALQTGEIRTFHIHVHDNSRPLKVTLVWTDAPGAGVINELYLRVEAPSGIIHDGDYDDQGQLNPYANVGVNGVQNNVQQITIQTPELGQHSIHVIAVNVTEGIDPSPRTDLNPNVPVQDFALVVSNGTAYSKQPISLMQVIDKSGSMGYFGYMEPAKLRAKEMVDILQINDKTGGVSFNQLASLDHNIIPISSFNDKEDVKNAIEPLTSGGTTSIGAGIDLAQAQFTGDGLPHAIVLISDGFSNTPPYAIDPPDGSAPVVDSNFIDSGTVIYTVALGPTTDINRLENIASITSGQFYQIHGFSDLHKLHEIYYNIQSLASGNEIIELDSDEVSPGDTNIHLVEIDDDTFEAFFACSSDKEDDGLHLSLIDPTGRIFEPTTPDVIYRAGDGHRFYRVIRPKAGLWSILVDNNRKEQDQIEQTRYTVAVIGDSNIKMETNVVGKCTVGEDLYLNVDLRQNGNPIKNAIVKARIEKLSEPLDKLVKRYSDQLKKIRLDKEATSHEDPLMARLTILDRLLTEQGKKPIFTTKTEEFMLSPIKELGTYNACIFHAVTPGTYTIRISARGIVGREPSTIFTRKATQGIYITPKPRRKMDFKIRDIFLVPWIVKKPGSIRFQQLTRFKNVLGVIVVDADGTPSTPREGTIVGVTITFPDGNKMALEDIPYSKNLGAYYLAIKRVKGIIEVTAKATRNDVTRTRTEKISIK